MQTVASLAERLDMSAEEAVETLRKIGVPLEGVESEITAAQVDILIDVDEDPSVLDKILQKKRKDDEAEKKRKQKADKKAADEKKAAARKTGDEKAEVIVDEEVGDEPEAEILGDSTPEEAPAQEIPVAVGAAPVEIVTAEPVVSVDVAVAEPEPEPVVVATVEVVETVEAPVPVAVPAPTPAPTVEPMAEILPPEEPGAPGEPGQDDESARGRRGHDSPMHESTLAKAEILHEKEDRLRQKKKLERPLPTPDPDVVAAVIRRDQEKRSGILRAEAGARRRPERPGALGATPPPAGASRGRDTRNEPPRDSGKDARGLPKVIPLTIEEQAQKEQQYRNAPKKGIGAAGKAVKKKPKRAERARVLEDTLRRDAAAAVKEFQSGTGGLGSKKRRKKRAHEGDLEHEAIVGGSIEVDESMTVEQLADAMSVGVNDLILDLMDDNMMVTKNQSLDIDVIRKLAVKRGFDVTSIIPEEDDVLFDEPDAPEDLVFRAPVVTVMGHVDHGKTSLLDVVRKANVAHGEAGGITQHIAAYDVAMGAGRVVFLDTPGHEAFTQMRSRGAQITDVVVLVVAADDGVKPQTIEAIDHAKAANVPIVVAINKCDKPGAQPDRVRGELANYGLQDESWGGKTIVKNVSAHTGEGIDELMELLVLESEMLELKANPNKRARGAIVESELSKGHGPVAWVLVQNGTLRIGDVFLCGETYGRVRMITTSKGRQVKEVGPATPVLVTGFNAVCEAGDQFVVVQEERVARTIATKRAALSRQKRSVSQKRMTLEDFHALMEGVEQKTLNVIIKADAQGSVDVLCSSFAKLGNAEVSISVVHAGVGGINESDVLLASASNAVVIGFHVTAGVKVRQMAEAEGVDIRTYLIIYEAIDQVTRALEGMLTPDTKEIITGHAEIRQVFRSSKVGNIAGSFQLDGDTERGALARLLRDNIVIYSGKIATVRRERDEVKSVTQGYECGLKLDRFDDIQPGDIIETYKLESIAKTLE